MQFISSHHKIKSNHQGCVATIGNFDGLHVGHRQILSRLQQQAKILSLPTALISFEPLPAEFFLATPPARIYPLRDKIRLLKTLEIEQFYCFKFDHHFCQLSAENFVHEILLKKLKVRYLIVGDDFRFGCKRVGDFKLLQQIGKQTGMTVENTPTYKMATKRVSSSRIRTALAKPDLALANQLLGVSYQLSGRVRHGDKLGRTLGFPTLNLRLPQHIALSKGIYSVHVYGLTATALAGVAYLGTRPVVNNNNEMRLEVYLFNYNQQVYGKYIVVEPIYYIREDQNFSSFEALKKQIEQDKNQAKNYFKSHH